MYDQLKRGKYHHFTDEIRTFLMGKKIFPKKQGGTQEIRNH